MRRLERFPRIAGIVLVAIGVFTMWARDDLATGAGLLALGAVLLVITGRMDQAKGTAGRNR